MVRGRVLVVEDDEPTRDILVRILGREGYRCTTASDVAEARKRLTAGPYDLIVCDVRLPDGSGLDLVAAALPRYDSVPTATSSSRSRPTTC